MMRTRLLIAAAAAVTALVAPAVASAGTYPPPVTSGQGTAVPSRVGIGGYTTFSGGGFRAATRLTISDNNAFVKSTDSERDGTFSTRVYFNSGAKPGRHVLAAKGTGANGGSRTVTAVVEVLGESVTQGDVSGGGHVSEPSHGGLAFTGLDAVGIVVFALLLILIGSFVLMVTERRYRRRARRTRPV